ncbi:MAG: FMN-binding protein, partial [Hyphomicrobiales bacterium]|nr:FMN-binding protein [Hyphomicrobiales bacterium]
MLRWLSFFLALVAALAAPAAAEKGKLRERLTSAVMAVVHPGAERLGPEEGSPPAIAVYQGGKVVAYVFSTLDIVAAVGYSATSFDVIAGVDLDGRITGAKVIAHTEPYILNDHVREQKLDTFLAREAGRPLSGASGNVLRPDFVAGATISARAMRAAVLEAAQLVLRTRSARAAVTVPTLDADSFSAASWEELLATGAVVRRRVTSGEVAAALAKAGLSGDALVVPLGKRDDLYVELIAALFTPRAIGGNLLGIRNFEEYKQRLPLGAWAIMVAANGPYAFLSSKYVPNVESERFDRLRLVQGTRTFDFVRADFQRVWTERGGAGIRGQQDVALFAVAASSGFDPVKPWRLELLVSLSGAGAAPISFGLDYKLPDAHVLMPPPPPLPPWVEAWRDSRLNVALLALLLSALTLIFIFQDALSRSRSAHRLVRNGFLAIVLVWLGWTAGAQLSIVNIISYIRGPFAGVDIGFYLA